MQPTQPSLREIKRFLSELKIDYSDCFEKSELTERYRMVHIEQQRAQINAMKERANAALKRRSFEFAVRLYTEAALACTHLHVEDVSHATSLLALVLANRSLAYIHLALPRRALIDAQHCVRLNPGYARGRARYAAAYVACERPERAVAQLR